ncbi:proteasome subunit beta type-3-like [Oscarella lobularis]|uniref:proteasome subunit beta type-3-like n=1 Tax=Oscarella lobularis TaxID=121494 RepID=UPI003313D221
MSAMELNGSAIVAMAGHECVAIASDKRLGRQAQTISFDFKKIYPIGDRLFLGLPGLGTDVQTVANRLQFRLNLYKLRENREMKPRTLLNMVSSFLYEHRFGPYFVEPIVAGLDPTTFEPFVASMDLIGCPMITSDFVVGGTAAEQLYGMCETLWRPDMGPDDLFEITAQSLLNAQDRDALSGWGGVVHLVEKDKVTTRHLKARMD